MNTHKELLNKLKNTNLTELDSVLGALLDVSYSYQNLQNKLKKINEDQLKIATDETERKRIELEINALT
jgi:uncharacterized protein (DUF111 family)